MDAGTAVSGRSVYNYFRDYDPVTGRYKESDPIGLGGGTNTYTYVGGDPVGWVDLHGENEGLLVDAAIVGIAAGTVCYLTNACQNLGKAIGNVLSHHNESADPDEGKTCPETPPYTDTPASKPAFSGKPGSTVRGGTQSTTYGPDGFPETQRDTGHPDEKGIGSGDHVHDWGRPSDGSDPTHRDRSPISRLPRAGDPPVPRGANVPPP